MTPFALSPHVGGRKASNIPALNSLRQAPAGKQSAYRKADVGKSFGHLSSALRFDTQSADQEQKCLNQILPEKFAVKCTHP